MPPQPPFILADNVYDRINLYPSAVLSSSAAMVGREVKYIADYRRERTYLQFAVAAANQTIDVDLGVGNTALIDTCWIDRGHNLWGHPFTAYASNDNYGSNVGGITRTVPAFGTVGGDPTTSWCVTEEGAIYTFITGVPAARYFRAYSSDVLQTLIPGLILGKRVQLLNYSSVRDEDAGERSNRIEKSLVPGYEGRDRVYARRTINLRLSTIGVAEYDSSIRTLRRLLFEIDQPAIVCQNYGDKPERAWLYQYEGQNWSSPTTRVLRDLGLQMSEVGPLVR